MASLALQQEIELTAEETAGLMGCDLRSIQRYVKNGKLPAVQRLNERNRPCYYIPLSALDAKAQRRYFKGTGGGIVALDMPVRKKPLEQFSLLEQEKIRFWTQLLEEWQGYRNSRQQLSKVELDDQFVVFATIKYQEVYQKMFERELSLSASMLCRRWREFREQDLEGLLDKRGLSTKGKSAIHPTVWDVFLSYYLDEARHPVARCLEYTQLYVQERLPELYPDIPSASSFYRKIERDIPEPLKVLGREGEKAYRDRCAPYILRLYDQMESNEYWVADTHTLDVISADEKGKTHRLYLVAFFDARSGIFVGCHITETPSSQATLIALRKAIQQYGIPQYIYVDNGREFLTHDVGGLGHRAKKKHQDEFNPPPVFERLGITMTNAIVRNARAKIIERRFRDVKDHLSRLFPTFTGGNVVERPEQLKYNLKAGKIVADRELTENVNLLLKYYFNEQAYGGAVVKDRGKPRKQVYNENLHTRRVAREEDLNLLMMRSSRLQKITRRGVNLKIGGVQYDYFNDEMINTLFGQEVYCRYDPEDLSSVRVYNKEGALLTVAPVDNQMIQRYGASKEDLAAAMREERRYEKAMITVLEHSGLDAVDRIEAINLLLAKAKQASEAPQEAASPSTIELEMVRETPMINQAVGFEISDKMLENARKYHDAHFNGGETDE